MDLINGSDRAGDVSVEQIVAQIYSFGDHRPVICFVLCYQLLFGSTGARWLRPEDRKSDLAVGEVRACCVLLPLPLHQDLSIVALLFGTCS